MGLRRKRLVAAKIETTPGTAIALSNSDGNINCYNATIQQDIELSEREAQAYFGTLPSVPGLRRAVGKWSTDFLGGASDPYWGSVFARAAGMVGSGGVYTPKTEAPGSNLKTLTVAVYQDGCIKKMAGASLNAIFNFVSGKIVSIDWTALGIWIAPVSDGGSPLTPTFPTTTPLRFANAGLSVAGAWSPRVSMMKFDLGNQIVVLPDANDGGRADGSGLAFAMITGRKPKLSFDPEAVALATNDTYGQFLAGTEQMLAWALGSMGNKVAFFAPNLQIINPQEQARDDVECDMLDCQLNRSSGDDEFSFTFT